MQFANFGALKSIMVGEAGFKNTTSLFFEDFVYGITLNRGQRLRKRQFELEVCGAVLHQLKPAYGADGRQAIVQAIIIEVYPLPP